MIVYVLELEQGKYYVGRTEKSADERYEEHVSGEGSEWTKKYKPVKIVEVIHNCEEFDEEKYTKIYMKKYGIDNVRGGPHVQMNFSDEERSFINKSLNNDANVCFRCGRPGHFAKTCKAKICTKCGRNTHTADKCYAKTHLNGSSLDKIECTKCGRNNHTADKCYAKTHLNGSPLSDGNGHIENNDLAQAKSAKESSKESSKDSVVEPSKDSVKVSVTVTIEQENTRLTDDRLPIIDSALGIFGLSIINCKRCGKPGHLKFRCKETHDSNGKLL